MSTYAQIKNEGQIEGKEEMIVNGWKNGISLQMLITISGLTIKQVESIIEKYKASKA